MYLFEKTWKELSLWSPLWLLAAIFGNPVYNVVAYYVCIELGYYQDLSTNVVQVNLGFFILVLLILFALRYVIYRIVYVVKLKDQMTTWFFLEAFAERHKFQLISLATFFMWISEVEGNVAGFIYFPITIVLTLSVSVITLNRLLKMGKYLEGLK
ncbi:hypothetical protein [Reichenbachiella ulvae]|uniref:Uncharacterized protein n=1 Tax=Reichenbachiella ulvae TaxID=2980104 RepID=A0ABT3CYD3_9BACT|nr:hypothetical protein [Reichenbachiella ulvae]MCV9388707.1 hypothetical protein [Reichenbachiella ulvae]